MNTKKDPLASKLIILKKMLEGMQEDLDVDYQVEDSLREIIDMCDEAIVMRTTETAVEPLCSTPIYGDQPIPDPLAEAKIDIYNQHFNRKVNF